MRPSVGSNMMSIVDGLEDDGALRGFKEYLLAFKTFKER